MNSFFVERTTATATNKRIVSVEVGGNPARLHGVNEGRDVRPRHAHFAVHIENDVVSDESGIAAVLLHLVEEVNGVPVPATAGIGIYQTGVGIDVNVNAVVLESEEQGSGGGDPPCFSENFEDNGDCRSGEKWNGVVGGSNPLEDGEGKVAFVVKA